MVKIIVSLGLLIGLFGGAILVAMVAIVRSSSYRAPGD